MMTSRSALWPTGDAPGRIAALAASRFFPSKNLGRRRHAGLVTNHDDALARRARLLRTHGMEPEDTNHHFVGANFRMDALQAAILRVRRRVWRRGPPGAARMPELS